VVLCVGNEEKWERKKLSNVGHATLFVIDIRAAELHFDLTAVWLLKA
jgi:hypothetical protein